MNSPASLKTGNALIFEAETCGRCGGSGHYSYCQRYGTTCFGCGGHGIKLTKRGAAAQAFYHASLEVPVTTVQVGQLVHFPSGPLSGGGFMTVTAIEDDTLNPGQDRVTITGTMGDGTYSRGTFRSSTVRVGWTVDEKIAKRAAALAYQDTLTKAGKPRKR